MPHEPQQEEVSAADSTVTVVSLMGVLLSWVPGADPDCPGGCFISKVPYPPRVMKGLAGSRARSRQHHAVAVLLPSEALNPGGSRLR
nr:hypothetical protein KitaXyl93_12170 [Kitasatospora sp. Xyl93]